jgi:hypothetical protein
MTDDRIYLSDIARRIDSLSDIATFKLDLIIGEMRSLARTVAELQKQQAEERASVIQLQQSIDCIHAHGCAAGRSVHSGS